MKTFRVMGRLVAIIGSSVTLSSLLAAPAVVARASPDPIAHVACYPARIGGQHKCLARGEYCARRYERQYEQYGFTCDHLDYRGRWHLEYR